MDGCLGFGYALHLLLLGGCYAVHIHALSTNHHEHGKKCRKLIFSGYISVLLLIENLTSPQKSPLRVLHNLHIN